MVASMWPALSSKLWRPRGSGTKESPPARPITTRSASGSKAPCSKSAGAPPSTAGTSAPSASSRPKQTRGSSPTTAADATTATTCADVPLKRSSTTTRETRQHDNHQPQGPSVSPLSISPVSGGGLEGPAWGTAVAPNGSLWFTSFGGNAVAEFASNGIPLSPSSGWSNGGINHPQGVAVDQKGNIWIANSFGPTSAPGQGDVVVYPDGNPAKAITITGGGLNHPFAIQIDSDGRAWVDNAGLGGAKLVGTKAAVLIGKASGSVTVIGSNFKPTSFSPIQSSSFKFPLGLALDSAGNSWVVSFDNSSVIEIHPSGTVARTVHLPGPVLPWADAVDGSNRVWVTGFTRPGVWLLCGVNTAACGPGSSTGSLLSPKLGFRSKAMQHLTSVQIDQSGDVWLSNNWSKIVPPTGGNGVVEMIGMATPVCTPLIGAPVRPTTTASCAGRATGSG